jgi:putative MFS transporter
VIAAEEYPAERRGFVIGVIQACNSLGSITCAAVVPFLLRTPYGWRTVYFVGVIPLLLLAYARRGLRETERFSEYAAQRRETTRSLFAIFHSPYRKRVLQMALIWGLTYMCTNTAVLFWKEFAVGERGFTDAAVGRAVAIASLAALPLVFTIGRFLDRWGRRRGAVLIYSVCAVFVVLAYQLHGFWALTFCLAAAIFAAIALLALLNAYTTELFPTEMRADAFAWSNNLLGRIGYVIAPGLVGLAAGHIGWGSAVSLTVVFVVAALVLILVLLPETSRRELEETAQL